MPRNTHNSNPNENPFHSLNTTTRNGAGASETTVVKDTSSLFYIHHADHPDLKLVSHILVGSNYIGWSIAMMMAFEAKNKSAFLDGTILQPAVYELLFPAWKRCNSMIKSWILNSVSEDISASLLYIRTAAEVRKELHDHYLQSNRPRIYQHKKSLSSLHQGSLDVTCYYNKLKTLWDELHKYQPELDLQNNLMRP